MFRNVIPASPAELFSFKGTLPRVPYIARQAPACILLIGTMILLMALSLNTLEGGSASHDDGVAAIGILGLGLVAFGLVWMLMAQATKRLRDIGAPDWLLPSFMMATVGFTFIAVDQEMPAVAWAVNATGWIGGLALIFMPGKKIEFPETIYARKPSDIAEIDAMFAAIPDTGGNSFLTFIFPDNTKAEFEPGDMHQMKVGWNRVREGMGNGGSTVVTILRRDASDTIHQGQNLTSDRMWLVHDHRVWELTPAEIEAAMA